MAGSEAKSDKVYDLQYSSQVETGPLGYQKDKPATNKYVGVPEGTRLQMIKEEAASQEKRFFAILGSDTLSNGFLDLGGIFKPSELNQVMQDIAKSNPQQYAELQQLAQAIISHYKQDKSLVSKKAYDMALKVRANNFQDRRSHQAPQKTAITNQENAKQLITGTSSLSGAQIHANMKKLLEYIDYEAKMYESIPALPVNQNAIDASRQRYNNYINTYNKYIDLINGYIQSGTNPAIIYDFLSAYQNAPLSQHTEAELKALANLVRQYEIKKQLANENAARNYGTETDSKYNFMNK